MTERVLFLTSSRSSTFFDGNGRAGRIIMILFLGSKCPLDLPVLYLSRYISDHKTDYYKHIRGITEDSDWDSWLHYMPEAIRDYRRSYTKSRHGNLAFPQCDPRVLETGAFVSYSPDHVDIREINRHVWLAC